MKYAETKNVEKYQAPDRNRTHNIPYISPTLYHWAMGTYMASKAASWFLYIQLKLLSTTH